MCADSGTSSVGLILSSVYVQRAARRSEACGTVAAGPLGENAAKQLQPLGMQLTRLSLQEGGKASEVTARAGKVD